MQKLEKYNFKNKVLALFSLLFLVFFSSCEDVVTLDLETGETKIVVDAEIIWLKGTTGNEQTIKISKTAPYYNNTTPKVSGAQVKVQNSNGDVFTFNETEPGSYVCTNFVPVLNMNYTLFVTAEGQSFTAVEKLTSVTPIDRVEQKVVPDFGGEDVIELTFYYKDPVDETNFYLTDYKSDFLIFPEYELTKDELYNGNEINTRFSDEDKIQPGTVVDITNRGISKNFYNYMNLILDIYGGSPFSIPPGNIRGNIVNTSDANNFAFGYFRLCEADKVSYVVK
ncbi:DUF4249 domain-containing protein [Flavobacterium sp. ANB]|uniref:DUF4249 domain-containing protein n=1 Tax=unclassified Flavobacterium TaxID=196869 RepID=UPI0012B72D12|nr:MULTISPECIES: DUF4249 domain-containing protein [unclassified Flavobacterium]MBF4518649.1 DUF4249 domain-containing protein [Flavobacterium sp. ANB]MTD67845.1 DUF4249 family protein [Flavobacterium sp. LC2016-13]